MIEQLSTFVPPQWSRAEVVDELHCHRCGYDLRTLSANGRCPECGLEIWATVEHTVDPEASRLPSLHNPKSVGNALFLLTLCALVGTLLQFIQPLNSLTNSWNLRDLRDFLFQIPALTWPYAIALGVIGTYAIFQLTPPRDKDAHGAVRSDIWRLIIGWLGWLACSAMWVGMNGWSESGDEGVRFVVYAASATFAAIGLHGLSGIFRIIGHRSRAYRQSHSGRQSLELMITAIACGVLAALVRVIAHLVWKSSEFGYQVEMIATAVLWATMLMIVIGLTYLLVNAWWIRDALRRPPPSLEEILTHRTSESN